METPLPPPFCASTNGDPPDASTQTNDEVCLTNQKVCADISATLSSMGTADERSQLIGATVRLSFHDAAEYDRTATGDSLGPDGCLSSSVENRGLVEPEEEVLLILEPIWQVHCHRITRADFWQMAARCVIIESEPTGFIEGLLKVRYGRSDSVGACETPGDVNRVAQAKFGPMNASEPLNSADPDSTQANIVDRMGLTVFDAVALLGAHTVGSMTPKNSGYGGNDGPDDNKKWVRNSDVFDNEYYASVTDLPWTHIPAPCSDPPQLDCSSGTCLPGCAFGEPTAGLEQWSSKFLDGPNEDIPSNLLLLNVDMGLAFDIAAEAGLAGIAAANGGAFRSCGGVEVETCPAGPATREQFDSYHPLTGGGAQASNERWLADFADAFNRMGSVGYGGGTLPDGVTHDFRLGTLQTLDFASCPAMPVPPPAASKAPTNVPSAAPSGHPTANPSRGPSSAPSGSPTVSPSNDPSKSPSETPSVTPSASPTGTPPVSSCTAATCGNCSTKDECENAPPPPPSRRGLAVADASAATGYYIRSTRGAGSGWRKLQKNKGGGGNTDVGGCRWRKNLEQCV